MDRPRQQLEAKDRAAWRRWLERNHATSDGVWLVIAKKGSGLASVTQEEAVEEALCFGWIDAKANRLDDRRWKQWMGRRKPGSGWSALNKRRAARLIAEGRMAPAGLATIEAAKADGSWTKLDASHALTVPPDLARALRAHPNARERFDAFPPSSRRAILEWIDAAKRPETRARRIEETARLAEDGIRANQPRQRGTRS
jgi:uncharacterized protein YdeI (YjbR/CyaY-like superfamily)